MPGPGPVDQQTERIYRWIVTEGRTASSMAAVIHGCVGVLNQMGLGIMHQKTALKTLHPEILITLYSWEPEAVPDSPFPSPFLHSRDRFVFADGFVEEVTLSYQAQKAPSFQASPFKTLEDGASMVHCPIAADATTFPYPVLADLQQSGATDYLALSSHFNSGTLNCFSWATHKPGGFTEQDMRTLEAILPALSLCLEMHLNHRISEILLQTYLGRDPGRKVFSGQIQRGDIQEIEAVIWYSDLRGFTALSETTDTPELIEWLNDYFETVATILAEHDGEILKFIGDAVLAVFPVSNQRRGQVCEEAVNVALRVSESLQRLNEQRLETGLPTLAHGVALHAGRVQYGNIGSRRRLDFTVIGNTVNLASRIAGLCGRLEKELLFSEHFATHLRSPMVKCVGQFDLKGVNQPQAIFCLKDDI